MAGKKQEGGRQAPALLFLTGGQFPSPPLPPGWENDLPQCMKYAILKNVAKDYNFLFLGNGDEIY